MAGLDGGPWMLFVEGAGTKINVRFGVFYRRVKNGYLVAYEPT